MDIAFSWERAKSAAHALRATPFAHVLQGLVDLVVHHGHFGHVTFGLRFRQVLVKGIKNKSLVVPDGMLKLLQHFNSEVNRLRGVGVEELPLVCDDFRDLAHTPSPLTLFWRIRLAIQPAVDSSCK